MALSEAELQYRSCLKKRYYKTANFAQNVAAQRNKETGDNLISYKCKFARHWHIGHDKFAGNKRRPVGDRNA